MEHRPVSPDPLSSAPRAPRGIRLERSPFEPGVMVRGVLAGLVLAGLLLAIGFPLTAATPVDADLAGLSRVNVSEVDWLVTVAAFMDRIGHLVVVLVFAAIATLWARWRWGTWDLGLLLFVVIAGSQAVTGVAKLLTDRPRPDAALVDTLSSAFPSGHAVRAAAVYGLVTWLVLLVVRSRPLRLVIAALAVLTILGSALARVALVAHWPTDVVAGVVVGTTWLVLALQLVRPQLIRLPASESGSAVPGADEPGAGHLESDPHRHG